MEITRNWILEWAANYDKENPKEREKEETLLNAIKKMGSPLLYITKDILMDIADWKAPRIKGYVKNNDPKYVEEVTRASFSSACEKLKLEVLTLLNGVDVRMASATLQFCFPEQYVVMDWRAWESLKNFGRINGEIEDTYESYKQYNDLCHEISNQFKVPLRVLDKALWQWKGGI
jgi:hypothetical protein